MPERVSLAASLSEITEHWRPRVVGELNGQTVLLFEPLGVLNTGNVTHPTLTAPVDVRL
jgi:hypothetical protein